MSVNGLNATQTNGVYDSYWSHEREEYGSASSAGSEKTGTDNTACQGVVYEKNNTSDKKATYSVNKMSSGERAALVQRLKADQESRQRQLVSLVQNMLKGQANAYGAANGKNLWRTLASGNFTVDAATREQAQRDIAEDGYWGVRQTSQRLFDFASALAGDDVEKMKEMQAAMEKGFQKATKAWGGELPGICQETMSAANKLFEDYYAGKSVQ